MPPNRCNCSWCEGHISVGIDQQAAAVDRSDNHRYRTREARKVCTVDRDLTDRDRGCEFRIHIVAEHIEADRLVFESRYQVITGHWWTVDWLDDDEGLKPLRCQTSTLT